MPMTDTLLAWIDGTDPARLRWHAADGRWADGSYAEFAAALGERDATLLVDGAQVTLLLAELPVGDARTARQALPYAVEERLAQPLEQLRLAHAPLSGGRFLVAAMARELAEGIVAALGEAGLRPRQVVPEFCALPLAEAGWAIRIEGGQATVRSAGHAGIKIACDMLAPTIAQLRREFPATARIDVYAEAAARATFPEAACAGLDVAWHAPLPDATALATLAAAPPLSLVEGLSDPRLAARGRTLWRAVAVLALVLACGWPALLAWQHALLENNLAALTADNSALFRHTFPAVTRVVNPRVQADQALAALRAGVREPSRFLEWLARVDAVRAAAFPADAKVTGITYSAGQFELAIDVSDMSAVERVRAALLEAGLQAETLAAEAASERVAARLRVRGES